LGLIHHSLLFYVLKTLPWLLSDYQDNYPLAHAEAMKFNYSRIVMTKPNKFDLKMVILVKVVTYFIGSQFPQTIADFKLEADIYRCITQTLIGKSFLI
jgi:hypothetical protein